MSPGESETMSFTLDSRDLASFNTDASSWIADAGEYKVLIGASSKDIRQTGSFVLKNEKIVKKVSKALSPVMEIKTHPSRYFIDWKLLTLTRILQ